MDVRKEIDQYASDSDRDCLYWLFDKYHRQTQWDFVAKCIFVRYGKMSYELYRVWEPTLEGRALFTVLR